MGKTKSVKHKSLTEKQRNIVIISSSIFFTLLVVFLSFVFYLNKTYKATSEARRYLISDDDVTVEVKNNYYAFMPKNNPINRGLVFYQGMKVESVAYAPLMYEFAKNTNTFCALLSTSLNFPILDVNCADTPINDHPEINNWFLSGHSQGGTAASIYTYNHLNQINGLILLASYSSVNLSNASLKVASIYGDQDLVLNKHLYENSKSLLPNNFNEYVISGANHSGFGMYEEQERDGLAFISNINQIQLTVNYCKDNIF